MTLQPQGYFAGRTPSFACQADPRFSYCLYVPRHAPARSLLVAVHDTLRTNQALRDAFAEHAEATGTVVLAPLFAAGIGGGAELDGYKYLRARDVHYDAALIAMVDEVDGRYALNAERFALFGFSGGAHFSHRFMYLHPRRLSAVVVASPGSVTLPDTRHRWWAGLADFEERFGRPVEWDALRRIPIHLVVGARDTDPRGTVQSPDHPQWVEGADAAGGNRVERLRSLHEYLGRAGVRASYEEVAETGHEAGPIVGAAIRFLAGTARRPA